jgi:hypothetical protein
VRWCGDLTSGGVEARPDRAAAVARTRAVGSGGAASNRLSGRGGRSVLYGAGVHVAALLQLTVPGGDRALMHGPRHGMRRPIGGSPRQNLFLN